jgi:UDP:flavonoid glycosyltransferase YjiC (YdhE family)
MLGLARRLVVRGHRVRFLTGPAYEDAVRAAGADFVPLGPGAEFSPSPSTATGVGAVRAGVRALLLDPAQGQFQPLAASISAEPADAVFAEVTFIGAAALTGLPLTQRPPVIACGILPSTLSSRDCGPYGMGLLPGSGPVSRLRNKALNWVTANIVLRDCQREVDARMKELVGAGLDGLFLLDWPRRADLIAQFTVPEFEYPRTDAPDTLRFYGPTSRQAPTNHGRPDWWDDLDGTLPVIYVTQGTMSNKDFTSLIGPTLQALAAEDVIVAVSTGHRPVSDLPALPANARAAEFLPDAELMPKTSAYVTNGGYGGLHNAMESGVPIVVAGDTEDKPECAARVAWAGAGINLRTGRPKPDVIRDAVREVLNNPRYRTGSRRIGAAIAASPGVEGLINDMEALLRH